MGGALRSFLLALATGVAGAAVFWLLGRSWRIFRPEIDTAIGFGDVKLMLMIGAFLDWRLALLTVFVGSLAGTLIYLFTKVLTAILPPGVEESRGVLRPLVRALAASGFYVSGRGAGMLDLIPFGSLLAIGAAISLFFGETILTGYFVLVGLSPA